MVLSYIYVMCFSINLCGVEDSVENYQTYLISCSAVMVFEFYGILFFFVLNLISRSLSCFSGSIMLSLTFYFHCAYFSLAVEMFDRLAFRTQASQIAVTDPI